MFNSDPTIGMIGPRAFRLPNKDYSEALSWSVNTERVLELAGKMGVSAEKFRLDFFGGTMFWVRPEALAPLARELGLAETFGVEKALLDGGLEHATERLFATSVVAAGYRLANSDGGTPTWGGVGTVAGGAIGALTVSFIQSGIVAAGLKRLLRPVLQRPHHIILALLGHRWNQKRYR